MATIIGIGGSKRKISGGPSAGGGDKPLPEILDTDPLTFVRVDKFIENGYISLEKFGNPSSKVFSYNKNDEGWKTYTEGTKIPMNYGDKVQFTSYSTTGMSTSSTDYRQFKTNGVYNCGGDINSLLQSSKVCPSYCFYKLFYGCNIITAPNLTSITVNDYSYSRMFDGCTLLVNAPSLPATTLASNCYQQMFYGCTSLVNAPALLVTTLAYKCYYQMFQGCASLVNAPALPATTLADDCYVYMFYGCTNIKEIYCNIRYNSDGTTEITSMIGYSWLSGVPDTTDCTFHKNPDWSGPTRRGNNTIPSNWQIVNWTQDTM